VVISCDTDLNYRFLQRVANVFPDLGSRGGGNYPLALIVRITKSANR